MTSSRLLGQQSVFIATFRNDDGSLVDPETVIFMWRHSGSSTEETYTYNTDDAVTRVSLGVFQFTAPPFETPVSHHVRVKSTSPTTATEDRVAVSGSVFTTP